MIQDSDTKHHPDNRMLDGSNINPHVQENHLNEQAILQETDSFKEVLLTENNTEETEENTRFTGLRQTTIMTPGSQCAFTPLVNGVLSSTASVSSPVQADGSISSIHATGADDHLSLSNNRESNFPVINDVKNILQYIYNRPDVIVQLIDALHKDIQHDCILIKLITFFHHNTSYLQGPIKQGLTAQKSCEAIISSHSSKNSFLVKETGTSSPCNRSTNGYQHTESRQITSGRESETQIPLYPPESVKSISSQSAPSSNQLPTASCGTERVGKAYKCGDCNFQTKALKNMNGHLVSHHNKSIMGLRTYTCSFCKYRCADKYRLIEHELTHTKLKHFLCAHCGKQFSTKRGLKIHLKYQSNERPHKCDICGASFKVKGKLTHHMKLVHINKGKKPYQCGYCQYRASIRGNVNQHIKSVHKGKPVVVQVLEKTQ